MRAYLKSPTPLDGPETNSSVVSSLRACTLSGDQAARGRTIGGPVLGYKVPLNFNGVYWWDRGLSYRSVLSPLSAPPVGSFNWGASLTRPVNVVGWCNWPTRQQVGRTYMWSPLVYPGAETGYPPWVARLSLVTKRGVVP